MGVLTGEVDWSLLGGGLPCEIEALVLIWGAL